MWEVTNMSTAAARIKTARIFRWACSTLCLIIFFITSLSAQNYIHYTIDNGLPSDRLYNGLQDENGFILINSENGLIRFDGTNFTLFDVEDGLTNSDVIISEIDKDGKVWLSPFNGTVCTYKDGVIENGSNNPILKKLNSQFNHSDLVHNGSSESGYVIFYQLHSTKFLVVQGDIIKEFEVQKPISGVYELDDKYYVSVSLLEEANPVSIVCLNKSGKVIYEGVDFKAKINHPHRLNGSHFMLEPYLRRLLQLDVGSGRMKIIDSLKLSSSKTVLCPYLAIGNDKMFFVSDNVIYSSTGDLNNVGVLHKFNKNFEVRGLFCDRQNNLWAITWEDGIYLFTQDNGDSKFTNLDDEVKSFDVYKNENEWSLLTKNEVKWESEDGRFQSYSLPPLYDFYEVKVNATRFYSIGSNNSSSVPYQLLVVDKKTGVAKQIAIPLASQSVKDIDLQGNFVGIAYRSGIHFGPLGQSRSWAIGRTTAINVSENGSEMFIGTLQGVLRLSKENGKWDTTRIKALSGRHILSLEQDQHGILWIHEQNRIMAFYKGHVVATLNKSKGLVSKTINGISIGKDRLVVSTNLGVSIVNYELVADTVHIKRIKNFNKENGLYAEYNSAAAVFGKELVVQTKAGLSSYNLSKEIRTAEYKPRIMEFRANNKAVKLDSLQLSHEQNFISIDFASLIYGSQPQSYLYRLVEQGDQWQSTTDRTCNFLALPPGNYTFQLKASYNMGSEFGEVTELKFCIEAAFWQTLWFKIIVGLILLFLLGYPLYVYIVGRKKSLESEKDLAQLKMQALKAQMNPHFIFNSLNSIQSIVNNGEVELANEYIVQFSTLIRQSLNYSNVDYISLKDEVDFLHNYIQLEQLRFENIFDYSIIVSDEINSSETLLPPMMLQIYVENAIRHGIVPLKEGGFVSVLFELEDEYLKCSIEDNGVGRKEEKVNKNKVYTSRGTQLNEERAEMYQTILEKEIFITWTDKLDQDKNRKGTKVQIKIPII
jgi:ligand-binding sensor domain-containing protein